MTAVIFTDGVVELRPSTPNDATLIIAGRDAAFRRFIGEGSAFPAPEFVIVVDGSVVGWVDHDRDDDRWWLAPDEVNIGYHVFPAHRRCGYATRAVRLMVQHLRRLADIGTAASRARLRRWEPSGRRRLPVQRGYGRAHECGSGWFRRGEGLPWRVR
jgi:RimJ/RimL family protein N-acetyltransferase